MRDSGAYHINVNPRTHQNSYVADVLAGQVTTTSVSYHLRPGGGGGALFNSFCYLRIVVVVVFD